MADLNSINPDIFTLRAADLEALRPGAPLYESTLPLKNGNVHLSLTQDLSVNLTSPSGLSLAEAVSNPSYLTLSEFSHQTRLMAQSLGLLPEGASPEEIVSFINSGQGKDLLSFMSSADSQFKADFLNLQQQIRDGNIKLRPEIEEYIKASDTEGLKTYLNEGGKILENPGALTYPGGTQFIPVDELAISQAQMPIENWLSTLFTSMGAHPFASAAVITSATLVAFGAYYELNKDRVIEKPVFKVYSYQVPSFNYRAPSLRDYAEGRVREQKKQEKAEAADGQKTAEKDKKSTGKKIEEKEEEKDSKTASAGYNTPFPAVNSMNRWQKVIIVPQAGANIDAISSSLALRELLKAGGVSEKNIILLGSGKNIPPAYSGDRSVIDAFTDTKDINAKTYKNAVYVFADINKPRRAFGWGAYSKYVNETNTCCVDHRPMTKTSFKMRNENMFVNRERSCTASVLTELAEEKYGKIPFSAECATRMLAGLLSDTSMGCEELINDMDEFNHVESALLAAGADRSVAVETAKTAFTLGPEMDEALSKATRFEKDGVKGIIVYRPSEDGGPNLNTSLPIALWGRDCENKPDVIVYACEYKNKDGSSNWSMNIRSRKLSPVSAFEIMAGEEKSTELNSREGSYYYTTGNSFEDEKENIVSSIKSQISSALLSKDKSLASEMPAKELYDEIAAGSEEKTPVHSSGKAEETEQSMDASSPEKAEESEHEINASTPEMEEEADGTKEPAEAEKTVIEEIEARTAADAATMAAGSVLTSEAVVSAVKEKEDRLDVSAVPEEPVDDKEKKIESESVHEEAAPVTEEKENIVKKDVSTPEPSENTEEEEKIASPSEPVHEKTVTTEETSSPVKEGTAKAEEKKPEIPAEDVISYSSRLQSGRWKAAVNISRPDENLLSFRIPEGVSIRDTNGFVFSPGDYIVASPVSQTGKDVFTAHSESARCVKAEEWVKNGFRHLYPSPEIYLDWKKSVPHAAGEIAVHHIDEDSALRTPEGTLCYGTLDEKSKTLNGDVIVSSTKEKKEDGSYLFKEYTPMKKDVFASSWPEVSFDEVKEYRGPKLLAAATPSLEWSALPDGTYSAVIPSGRTLKWRNKEYHAGDWLISNEPVEPHKPIPSTTHIHPVSRGDYEVQHGSEEVEIKRKELSDREYVIRAAGFPSIHTTTSAVFNYKTDYQARIDHGDIIDRKTPTLGADGTRGKWGYEIDKKNGNIIFHNAVDRATVNEALKFAKELKREDGSPVEIKGIVIADDVHAMTGDAFVNVPSLSEMSNVNISRLTVNTDRMAVISVMKDKDKHVISPFSAIGPLEHIACTKGADFMRFFGSVRNGEITYGDSLRCPLTVHNKNVKSMLILGADVIPENFGREMMPSVLKIQGIDGTPVDFRNNAFRISGSLYNASDSAQYDAHRLPPGTALPSAEKLSTGDLEKIDKFWTQSVHYELDSKVIHRMGGRGKLTDSAEEVIRAETIRQLNNYYISSGRYLEDWRKKNTELTRAFKENIFNEDSEAYRKTRDTFNKYLSEERKAGRAWDYGTWKTSREYKALGRDTILELRKELAVGENLPDQESYKDKKSELYDDAEKGFRHVVLEPAEKMLALQEAGDNFRSWISSVNLDAEIAKRREEIIKNDPELSRLDSIINGDFEMKRPYVGSELLDANDPEKGVRKEISLEEDGRRKLRSVEDAIGRLTKDMEDGKINDRSWVQIDEFGKSSIGSFAFENQNMYLAKTDEREKEAKSRETNLTLREKALWTEGVSKELSAELRAFLDKNKARDFMIPLSSYLEKDSPEKNIERIADILIKHDFSPEGRPAAYEPAVRWLKDNLLRTPMAFNVFQGLVTEYMAIDSIEKGSAILRSYGSVTGTGAFLNNRSVTSVETLSDDSMVEKNVKEAERMIGELDRKIEEKNKYIEKNGKTKTLEKELQRLKDIKSGQLMTLKALKEGYPLISSLSFAGCSLNHCGVCKDYEHTKSVCTANRTGGFSFSSARSRNEIMLAERKKNTALTVLKSAAMDIGKGASKMGQAAASGIAMSLEEAKNMKLSESLLYLCAGGGVLILKALKLIFSVGCGMATAYKNRDINLTEYEKEVKAALQADAVADGRDPSVFSDKMTKRILSQAASWIDAYGTAFRKNLEDKGLKIPKDLEEPGAITYDKEKGILISPSLGTMLGDENIREIEANLNETLLKIRRGEVDIAAAVERDQKTIFDETQKDMQRMKENKEHFNNFNRMRKSDKGRDGR